jgi:hypothetical protein
MRFIAMYLVQGLITIHFVFADAFGSDTIPPRDSTYSTISMNRTRLAQFHASRRKLPKSLKELPLRRNKSNSTKDA